MKKLEGKTAIVTGASSGLGYEISKTFLFEGATVIGCSRSQENAERTIDKIEIETGLSHNFFICKCDVSFVEQVSYFFEFYLQDFNKIDILVNNAGIIGEIGNIDEINWWKWFEAININLLGSVSMCRGILPHFKSNKSGKIIQISGGGATNPTPTMSAYAASKAGIVRFMETVAQEVAPFNIDVNSVAPGMMNTNLFNNAIENKDKIDSAFYEKLLKNQNFGETDFKNITDLIVFLASEESNGITGKLISAQWDNWKEFPKHIDELKNSDVYTLRRIVGKDRDMSWGDK